MDYKKLRELTEKLINSAVKFEELECVLGGVGLYRVENINLAGEKEVAVNIIMDALYDLHKQHPEIKFDVLTEQAFECVLGTFKTVDSLNNGLRALEYHLYAEKSKIATFNLDTRKILECLKNNLSQNKDRFQDAMFQQMFKEHNNYISSNFGHRF